MTVAAWAFACLGAPQVTWLLLVGYLVMRFNGRKGTPADSQLVYLCRRSSGSGEWFLGAEPRRLTRGTPRTVVREVSSDEIIRIGGWCSTIHWPAIRTMQREVFITPGVIVPLPVGALWDSWWESEDLTDTSRRPLGRGHEQSGDASGDPDPTEPAQETEPDARLADALATFGLTSDATIREARRTHRRLVKEYHPDRGGDPSVFRAVQDAWQVIRSGLSPDEAP